MKLSDFDYNLPTELIAQYPAEKREDARMMVVDRSTNSITHRKFIDIVSYCRENDALVLNNTRVYPARLFGQVIGGRDVELLLHKKTSEFTYECLGRPGRALKLGDALLFQDGLNGEVIEDRDECKLVRFFADGNIDNMIDKLGHVPLPPYIKRPAEEIDQERYQTVFARERGSAAAPTAGLHFTKAILDKMRAKGTGINFITLDINYATFRPIKEDDIRDHRMYRENYLMPETTVINLRRAKSKGGKIIAVGTTAVRALESSPFKANQGTTDLFIHPGYEFQAVDAMITNFHFPCSTLLLLVSAFMGEKLWRRSYEEAIKEKYRFYSYGDCMLIL